MPENSEFPFNFVCHNEYGHEPMGSYDLATSLQVIHEQLVVIADLLRSMQPTNKENNDN